MLVLTPHSASQSLTMLSYDREAGMVIVKVTSPYGESFGAESTRIPLAQFSHEIGIPLPALRAVNRVQQGVWTPEPEVVA